MAIRSADGLAALLPHQDADTTPPMPTTDSSGADEVDVARPGVGDVLDQADPGQHDGDDDDLEHEPDPPRQVGGDEAAEERSDRGGDRRRRADEGVGLLLRRALRSCRG